MSIGEQFQCEARKEKTKNKENKNRKVNKKEMRMSYELAKLEKASTLVEWKEREITLGNDNCVPSILHTKRVIKYI